MGNALSMDLRVRFKRLMDGGMRAAEAGRVLLLSPATAARWGNKIRNGASLAPLRSGPRKGSGKLAPFFDFFVELIKQDPDITLVELQSSLLVAHEVTCSTSGIDALLRRRGYTIKKGLVAQEQGKPAVRKARREWGKRQVIMRANPERLIFLDETGTDTSAQS